MTRMLLRALLNKTVLVFIILWLWIAEDIQAQPGFTFKSNDPPTMQMLMDAREAFEYEVKYGPFTLGWVEVELLPDSTYEGEKAYHIRTTMKSNSRVLFVSYKELHYESLFTWNEDWPYSFVFWRDDIHDENYEKLRIDFDRENEKVIFYEEGTVTSILDLVEPASGGDIIFYYSRMFAGLEEPYSLPVYTEDECGEVTASSSGRTEMREYEAFDGPIETYLSEGIADIEGPFGFKGSFKSWFATDDLRIPVEAHVRVIFGNVKVRLISYKRNGNH